MISIGSKIAWAVKFTNGAGADADPASVRFLLREEVDGTELEWIYSASPVAGTHYPTGMSALVKDSTGDYSLAFVARKPERHTGVWLGSGTVDQTTQNTVFVRHSLFEAMEP